MNSSLLGSSIHRIIQARILESVAIPFSRGSSQPRDRTLIFYIAGRFFTIWVTREIKLASSSIGPKNGKTLNIKLLFDLLSPCFSTRASLVAQRLKCLPAVQKTWVRSLGQEDPLEREMTTHSSSLASRIPWMEEPGGLQSTGSQRVRHN